MSTYLIDLIIFGFVVVIVFLVSKYISKTKKIPRMETEGIVERVSVPLGKAEEPTFYIRYEVSQKQYTGMVGLAGAEGLDRNTVAGTKVTVLYDPENPQNFYCRGK